MTLSFSMSVVVSLLRMSQSSSLRVLYRIAAIDELIFSGIFLTGMELDVKSLQSAEDEC